MNQKFKLLAAGLLPIVIFTVIEEVWGTLWGLIAGMVFGVGEILWEYYTLKKVDAMTWGGNGMLLLLGGVSLATQEGFWFKLQPAILEVGFAGFLWGSLILNKSILLALAQKQGGFPANLSQGLKPGAEEVIKRGFSSLTLRLGLFFFLHAMLAVWAALYWSTTAWAILKGVGFTVSLLVYMVVESLILRYRLMSIP